MRRDEALSETDANAICSAITTHLLKMGAVVQAIGVHLETQGCWFSAVINGEQVWVRRGQGNWVYQDIAKDLLHSALEKRLAQFEEMPTDGTAPLTAHSVPGEGQIIHG